MLQKEFTELTGFEVTEEQFDIINAIYLEAYIEKIPFCREWKDKNLSESRIITDLMRRIHFLQKCNSKLVDARNREEAANDAIVQALDKEVESKNNLLFDMATSTDENMNAIAKRELGIAKYIRYRLMNGFALAEDETTYIANNLK